MNEYKTDIDDIADVQQARPEPITGEVVNLKQDIPAALKQWALDMLDIDNPCQLTQLQFNAGLMYIADRYISCMNNIYNGSMYNEQTIQELYSIYINLCSLYDKHICINGFSCITGIDRQVIYQWGELKGKNASRILIDISKRLISDSEESLQDLLVTGKRNPIGIVAILNNRHGWATSNNRHEYTARIESTDDIAGLLGVNS